jgi:hypothetical protein
VTVPVLPKKGEIALASVSDNQVGYPSVEIPQETPSMPEDFDISKAWHGGLVPLTEEKERLLLLTSRLDGSLILMFSFTVIGVTEEPVADGFIVALMKQLPAGEVLAWAVTVLVTEAVVLPSLGENVIPIGIPFVSQLEESVEVVQSMGDAGSPEIVNCFVEKASPLYASNVNSVGVTVKSFSAARVLVVVDLLLKLTYASEDRATVDKTAPKKRKKDIFGRFLFIAFTVRQIHYIGQGLFAIN